MSGINLQLSLVNLNVNLRLPGRGVNAIVGPSGSGKTTLLRAVAGLEMQVQGRVDINGAIWQDDSAGIFLPAYQRRVGFVFQEASLFPAFIRAKNIEFGLQRIAVSDRKIALSAAVGLLGIASLLQRNPATLSGGEKQRVAIARALATSPGLLLMDEPLASLDEQRKSEILPYLDKLHAELDMPILYVSHAADEVARLADYVVMLEAGTVHASGTVFEMIHLSGQHELVCSLIQATVIGYDAEFQLVQVDFSGLTLWLSSPPVDNGTLLRLRIQARDVSLSLQQQSGSSILNSIPVRVSAISDDVPGLVVVELNANGTRLLARITRKSVQQLQLEIGMPLFAQIKGVAIVKS